MHKPKLAVVSDSPYTASGFGNVAKGILTNLDDRYDVSVLAINYNGDWFSEQSRFKLYHVGDHLYGFNKIPHFIDKVKPDLIFVIQDPFISDKLITKIRTVAPELPSILYCPVDSPNIPSKYVTVLNQFDHVVSYTDFGRNELIISGLKKPTSVIPHGVDFNLFHPVKKSDARNILGIPNDGRYIVGYTCVNQPRKKIDVWLYVINKWLAKYPHDNVFAYYHGQLSRAQGLDIPVYIQYLDRMNAELGVAHRLEERFMITSDDPYFSVREEYMKYIYNSYDVLFHACANGGWELPIHETMACKVPCIVPQYSAMAEWPNDKDGPGVFYIPVNETPDAVTSGATTVHRTIDINCAVEALEYLYQNEQARIDFGNRGYSVATQDKFMWPNIALEFDKIFQQLLSRKG